MFIQQVMSYFDVYLKQTACCAQLVTAVYSAKPY